MPDLLALRDDPAALAAEASPVQLAEWQRRELRAAPASPLTCWLWARQLGKSLMAALLCLWAALRAPGGLVLVLSGSGELGARRVLADVRRAAAGSELVAASVADDQQAVLALTNGSEVRALPLSEAAARGWRARAVAVDEAQAVPESMWAALLPTLLAAPEGEGFAVLAGTASREGGTFYDLVRSGQVGDPGVRCSVRVSRLMGGDADAPWLSATMLRVLERALGPVRADAELRCRWSSGADALFTRAAIDAVTADFLAPPLEALPPPARLAGGLDLGATHDRSALAAVGRLVVPDADVPVFGVVGSKLWAPGHALTSGSAHEPGVAEEVAQLPTAWDTLVGEASGLGEAVCGSRGVLWRLMGERSPHAGAARPRRDFRVLAESPDDPLVGLGLARHDDGTARARRRAAAAAGHFSTRRVAFHVTAQGKAAMFSALSLLVGQRRLLIRASDEELIRALLSLRVDLSPGGQERVDAPRDAAGHADLASALALTTMVAKGRDGSWFSRLASLADPGRVRLPDPAVPPRPGPTVTTAGGVEVPRRPLIASVASGEVTDPDFPAALRGPEDPIPLWRRPV